MTPIYTISPVNKIKVIVGRVDLINSVAIFDITRERYFAEADACGLDLRNYNQKAVRYCRFIQFNLWDGRRFKMAKEDFEKKCFLYPPGDKSDYKANNSVFKRKLMITLESAAKLSQDNREKADEEMVKAAMM